MCGHSRNTVIQNWLLDWLVLWNNGRTSTCRTLSLPYKSKIFFFPPLGINPPLRWSLWRKQMTLWDRFQSINFQPSHRCAVVWVPRPPLNQRPEGCHFTPTHCHSVRKHWGLQEKARYASYPFIPASCDQQTPLRGEEQDLIGKILVCLNPLRNPAFRSKLLHKLTNKCFVRVPTLLLTLLTYK